MKRLYNNVKEKLVEQLFFLSETFIITGPAFFILLAFPLPGAGIKFPQIKIQQVVAKQISNNGEEDPLPWY